MSLVRSPHKNGARIIVHRKVNTYSTTKRHDEKKNFFKILIGIYGCEMTESGCCNVHDNANGDRKKFPFPLKKKFTPNRKLTLRLRAIVKT